MFFLALDEKIRKARKVLWEYDIDPFVGLENLCWAPNIKGQHSTKHVKDIIEGLKEVKEQGGDYNDVRQALIETLSMYKESASSFGKEM